MGRKGIWGGRWVWGGREAGRKEPWDSGVDPLPEGFSAAYVAPNYIFLKTTSFQKSLVQSPPGYGVAEFCATTKK